MEHGIKYVAFYVQKHIAPQAVCYNFMLVHDKPQGAPAYGRVVYSNLDVYFFKTWSKIDWRFNFIVIHMYTSVYKKDQCYDIMKYYFYHMIF